MSYVEFSYEYESPEGDLIELHVEADISDYVPAKVHGPAEDCYPAEGGEVELCSVKDEFDNDFEVDAELEEILAEKAWDELERGRW